MSLIHIITSAFLHSSRQPNGNHFFRHFANDWATKAFMLIYLKSRRNYLCRVSPGDKPEAEAEVDSGNKNMDVDNEA
jgi:hypothetical protein